MYIYICFFYSTTNACSQMSLRKGDKVEVLSGMSRNGWVWAEIEGVGQGYIPESYVGNEKPKEEPSPRERLSIVLRAARILAGSPETSKRSIVIASMVEKYEKIVSCAAKLLEACDRVEEVERTCLLVQKQKDLLSLSNRDVKCTPEQQKNRTRAYDEHHAITSTEQNRLKRLEATRKNAEREAMAKIREYEEEIKLGRRLNRMKQSVVEAEEQARMEKARWFPLSAPTMVSPMTEISSSSIVYNSPAETTTMTMTPPAVNCRVQPSSSSSFVVRPPPSLVSPTDMSSSPTMMTTTPSSLMTSSVTCVDELEENILSPVVVFSPLDRLMKISRAASPTSPSSFLFEEEREEQIEQEEEKENMKLNSFTTVPSDVVTGNINLISSSPKASIQRLRGILTLVGDQDEENEKQHIGDDDDSHHTKSFFENEEESYNNGDVVKQKLNHVWKLIDKAALLGIS